MIRWSIFSLRIFLRTRIIKLNGGEAKLYSQSQECRNASVVILSKSGFHAMYRGSWWQRLDVNRSRVGSVLCVTVSCKTEASSFPFWIALGVSWILVSMYTQRTEKVLCRHCNLFAGKETPNGLADVQDFCFVCTPHFQKTWKCSTVFYLQVNWYIWLSFCEC